MTNSSSPKALLRQKMLEVRKRIPSAIRRDKSRRIFKKLFRDPHFLKAKHIAFYYGIAPEVETLPFLRKILCSKLIYLPRVHPSKKVLKFHKVDSFSKNLEKNIYAIMEPKATCSKRHPSRMDLIVVPGVAFDKKGRRLGRGGGYYDRALRQAKKVYGIGLCFREQLVTKVPVTKRDMFVDRVITD